MEFNEDDDDIVGAIVLLSVFEGSGFLGLIDEELELYFRSWAEIGLLNWKSSESSKNIWNLENWVVCGDVAGDDAGDDARDDTRDDDRVGEVERDIAVIEKQDARSE